MGGGVYDKDSVEAIPLGGREIPLCVENEARASANLNDSCMTSMGDNGEDYH